MLDVEKLDIPENCLNFFDFINTRLNNDQYLASNQLEFLDYIINFLSKKRYYLSLDQKVDEKKEKILTPTNFKELVANFNKDLK